MIKSALFSFKSFQRLLFLVLGLFFLFVANNSAFSQNFCAPRVIKTTNDAHLVRTADVDKDGDQDIVSANSSAADGKIFWHENKGKGTFKTHKLIGNQDNVRYVLPTDLDQDGDIDVVVSSANGSSKGYIAWFENDGNENFTFNTIDNRLFDPINLHVEDVNSDGKKDIAAALRTKDKVVWYKNEGKDSFTRKKVDPNFNQPIGVYVADINSDGHMDLVSNSTIAYELNWYRNNGQDSFTKIKIVNGNYERSRAADLNGDGEMDIFASLKYKSKVNWFQNDGNQNFTQLNVSGQTNNAEEVLAKDFDGDSDKDIISASDKLYWHENDGLGNFTDHLVSSKGAFSCDAADFDGDGDMDIVAANIGTNEIFWLENNFPSDTLKPVACGSYTVPGTNKTYNSSGVYTHRIKRSAPCDSFLVIDLTIKNNAYNAISPKVCNQYTVPSGDETYTGSGRYRDTLPSSNGCDSILTIDLEVKNRDTIYPSVCDSFMVPSGDETYTQSGFYHDTIPGSSGCDSLIGIQLEMINRYSLDTSVCDSFWVPSGDEVYTKTGQYTDTLENQQGCDSIIDINLNLQKSRVTINPDACHEYILPSGGETYTSSGKYWDTLTNVHNCDSILNINLNIIEVDTGVTKNGTTLRANASGAQYRWLRCEDDGYSSITGAFNKTYEPFSNGRYAVEVTQNGCKDTSACVEVTSVGFKPGLSKRETFKIEPNPAEEKITVTFEKALSKGKITIKALDGRTLKTVPDAKGKQIGINISGLAKGVYGLVVTNEKGTRVRKLMKK